MSIMGETIDNFEFPVCNKFRPRILSGQLCYYVDVNKFMDQIEEEKLKNGLILLIDPNQGRMLTETVAKSTNPNTKDLFEILTKEEENGETMIHINTIGRENDFDITY